MTRIAVLGAGIAGVITAHRLHEADFGMTVIDRHRCPTMETSYANGGQFSASNAEVWTTRSTLIKGLRWMLRRDAPLLVHPSAALAQPVLDGGVSWATSATATLTRSPPCAWPWPRAPDPGGDGRALRGSITTAPMAGILHFGPRTLPGDGARPAA